MTRRARLAAVSIGLVAITLAAYRGVCSSAFINFDDDGYVSANAHVRHGLDAPSIAWAFTTVAQANWHPVTWLSHMLDAQLFGLDAGKHHRTSLLLHALNAVLLFLLLERMTGALWRCAFAAALFAIHPLHVESVAWIAERKDVLSTLFWLLTLAAWLRYVESKKSAFYALTLGLYALGLMSKPMLVTFPFTLLLLDFWPLCRTAPGAARLREKAPLFALSAASCVVTFVVQRGGGAVQDLKTFAFSERLANAIQAYGSYLGKTFWPARLAVFYPYPPALLLSWRVTLSAVVLAGITLLTLRLATRAPYLAVGWLWYLGTLVPVIGLVQVGGQALADRYTYVPLIGVFVALAFGLAEIARGSRVVRGVVATAAVASVVALAARTRVQVGYWAGDVTLFGHALAVTSDNWLAHNNLGRGLFKAGRTREAIEQYERALAISPAYSDGHYNLGIALAKVGRPSEAIEHFETALEIRPGLANAHNNLGGVLAAEGRTDAAVEHYRQALRLDPAGAEAPYNLANLLFDAGRVDEAIEWYRRALVLDPERAETHNNLGNALASGGRLPEAIAEYGEALRARPDYVEAHNNLGAALVRQGRTAEAIDQYQRALGLEPDYVEAENNLALALTSLNRWSEAIEHYERVLRIAPDLAATHNALGVALARVDRVRDALGHFERAVQLRPDFDEARANLRAAQAAVAKRP